MDRFYFRFGIAMMVFLPLAIVIELYRDFIIQSGGGDWQHNPHVYFPLVLLMLLCALPYMLYVLCGIRGLHKQIKQRAAYLAYLRKLNQK